MILPKENSPAPVSLSQPDMEVERCLLGAILANSYDALPQAIESKLIQDDFFREAHGEIYSVMLELYNAGNPVDLLAVTDALSTRKKLTSVGGKSYLSELYDLYGIPQNVGYYARLIIDRALLRRLEKVSLDIADQCRSNPSTVNDLLDEAEASIFKIRDDRTSNRLQIVSEHMADVFNKIVDMRGKSDAISGIPTGFTYLDSLTGGFQKTDLIVLGGRPGMGKTSLALNFAVNVAIPSKRESKRDIPASSVAVFSLEMGTEQLLQRLLCQIGHHDLLSLRSGRITDEEIERLTMSSSLLRQAPIFIDDTASISPLELRAKARRLQSQLRNQGQSLGLIVVDYLQLMRPNSRHNNREQEIREISGSLKALAKELSVTVLTLSQLKRSDELEPSLSDLRESGSIEQDADIVFFVLRKEMVKEDKKNEFHGQAELRLKKHRNGPTGLIKMHFIHKSSCFEPASNFHVIEGE
ncbi:MAG: replicative DNA helicase [Deltaproteobacteria bacterium]|jgi:replicative DNA helicase|nr:replicative DNA helicase [Deltaproteobacteria bacterium]